MKFGFCLVEFIVYCKDRKSRYKVRFQLNRKERKYVFKDFL